MFVDSALLRERSDVCRCRKRTGAVPRDILTAVTSEVLFGSGTWSGPFKWRVRRG